MKDMVSLFCLFVRKKQAGCLVYGQCLCILGESHDNGKVASRRLADRLDGVLDVAVPYTGLHEETEHSDEVPFKNNIVPSTSSKTTYTCTIGSRVANQK